MAADNSHIAISIYDHKKVSGVTEYVVAKFSI